MAERLYRSRSERMLGGVAGGMANALGVDVAWVRIAWVFFAFFTQGIAVLIYFVLLVALPEEPPGVTSVGGEPARTDSFAGNASPSSWGAAPTGSGAAPTAERASVPAPGNLPLVLGVVLILIGAWYLVRQLLPPIDFGALWPVVAIGLGVVLLFASVGRGRRAR